MYYDWEDMHYESNVVIYDIINKLTRNYAFQSYKCMLIAKQCDSWIVWKNQDYVSLISK